MEKSGDESMADHLTVVRSDKSLKDDSRGLKSEDEKHDLSKPKSQILITNGKDSDDEESNVFKDSSFEIRQLLRPFSMVDFGQTRQLSQDDAAARPKVVRSISSFNWNDKYEEYKPPKRYQKPITKINTRLSRTFVTGAGIEKCKHCGVRLYEMEKINANHFAYHRSCFRCSKCQRLLNLGTFTSVNGQLFCKSHFLHSIVGASGNQLTNEEKESTVREQTTYSHGKEISMDVTLTSVLDIKPHFEIPSKFEEGAMKNWRRHLQQSDEDIHLHRLNADYNGKESEKLKRESDKLLFLRYPNHMNQETKSSSLEIKPDDKNCKALSKDASLLLSRVEKGNNDEIDFQFSAAFAKHRNTEDQNEAKASLVHKMTAPKAEILPLHHHHLHHHHTVHPENKNIDLKYKDPGYFHSSVSSGQSLDRTRVNFEVNGLPAKALHDRNDQPKHALKQSYEDDESFELFNKDTQITGIAKRLRNHWEAKDPSADGRHFPMLKTEVHFRGFGMNVPPHKTFPRDNRSIRYFQNNVYGFKAGGDGLNHGAAELFFKGNAPPHEKSHAKEHRDANGLLIVPLNFTQTQLAKFKQLEAMALKYAQPYSTKKKFRWEVKEPNPLSRPTGHFNYDRTAVAAAAAAAPEAAHARSFSVEEHRFKSFPSTLFAN